MSAISQPLDAAGIERLFRSHAGRLRLFLLRRTKNEADAEELMQEAFLRALCSAGKFRGESAPETWLFSVALNAFFNRRKHERYAQLVDSIDEVEVPEPEAEDVMQTVARGEMLAGIEAVWDALPADMRRAMEMVVIDELAYDQAAVLLDIPGGTVRPRVSRARDKLKTVLTDGVLTRKGAT